MPRRNIGRKGVPVTGSLISFQSPYLCTFQGLYFQCFRLIIAKNVQLSTLPGCPEHDHVTRYDHTDLEKGTWNMSSYAKKSKGPASGA